MKVFWALLVFTILEYLYARFLPLGFVAAGGRPDGDGDHQGVLVGWYFMHLKFEGRWIYMMLVPVGLLAMIVVVGLTPDIAFHEDPAEVSPAVADR